MFIFLALSDLIGMQHIECVIVVCLSITKVCSMWGVGAGVVASGLEEMMHNSDAPAVRFICAIVLS